LSVRGEAGERARCDIANGSILRITRYGLTAYRVSDKKKKKEVYYSIRICTRDARSLLYLHHEVSRSPPNAANLVRYEG